MASHTELKPHEICEVSAERDSLRFGKGASFHSSLYRRRWLRFLESHQVMVSHYARPCRKISHRHWRQGVSGITYHISLGRSEIKRLNFVTLNIIVHHSLT